MTRDSVARISAVLCLAGAGVLVPALSGAQDGAEPYPPCAKEPTDADVEGAKGAHKAATQFFERGDYERAIQYWNDAYEFDCTKPALLLNIANAHEKKGDKQAAVDVLEVYLERAPEAEDADTVRAKVENLKAALTPEPPPTATAEPTATVAPPPPPPPETEGERPYGVVPWVVAGGGLAVSIGGLIPLLIGQSKVSEAEEDCPTHQGCSPEAKDTGDTGNSLRLIGSIIMPVGLVALAGGLVWQFAFNQPAPAEATTGIVVAPQAGPDSAGLVVGGQF